MNLVDLVGDVEFGQRFPYVWLKLEPYLLQRQRDYAAKHKGEHEMIGQYVEFLSEIMTDLNELDANIVDKPGVRKHPKLRNSSFKP
jgi:hypothetical protein